MIDVSKIKIGDKLRVLAKDLLDSGINEIVEVVEYIPGDYWINGGEVVLDCLEDDEKSFELVATNTKYSDIQEGDVVEVALVDEDKLQVWPKMAEMIGRQGKVTYKGKQIEVNIDSVSGIVYCFDAHELRVLVPAWDNFVTSYNYNPETVKGKGDGKGWILQKPIKSPIVSDGGSSSYYTIPLPDEVIEKIVKNRAIETEDILKYGLGNDFDFSNAGKSLIRLWGTINGAGKAGNDAGYEIKKIRYSLDKIEKFYTNK